MGKPKRKLTVPTYFEVSVDNEIRRYTTTEYLPGRKEVFDFCIARGIAIRNEFQVVSIILRSPKSNIVLVTRKSQPELPGKPTRNRKTGKPSS